MSRKEQIRQTFNTVADGYDNEALWFFPESAKLLPDFFRLKGNEHILDVATGTGTAAFSLARALPLGKVTAIDYSPGMLNVARRKAATLGVENVNFFEMDYEKHSLPDAAFAGANCSFGIFFVEDMILGLRSIARAVRSGGKVVTTCFGPESFLPHADILLDQLESQGIERPPISYKNTDTEEKCGALFEAAGLTQVRTSIADLSRTIVDPNAWWNIVWNAGYRSMINQLGAENIPEFKRDHLEKIATLVKQGQSALKVNVIFTSGIVI